MPGLQSSPTATASVKQAPLTISDQRMLGPGPVVSHCSLGDYHLLFRDTGNRTATPGMIFAGLRRRGRPLNGDRVTVTYR